MLTRLQWKTISFFVGLPFVLFVLLNFLNPGYMAYFFLPNALFDGIQIILFLSVANFLILYFGLRFVNKRRGKQKADESRGYPCGELFLIIVCILLFTLPSLWIVFFYPSLIKLTQVTI